MSHARGSAEARALDARLNAELAVDACRGRPLHLLLLGRPAVGKSTLRRQMERTGAHEQEQDERTFEAARASVHASILRRVYRVIERTIDSNALTSETRKDVERIRQLEPYSTRIDSELSQLLTRIWNEPSLRWIEHDTGHDNLAYFMAAIERIAAEDYTPTADDLMRAYDPSSTFTESLFECDGQSVRLMELTRTGNFAKPVTEFVDPVDCVIFTAALSHYAIDGRHGQQGVTALHDAMGYYMQTCNSRWFRHCRIVLLLTKRDTLVTMLDVVPLVARMPELNEAPTPPSNLDAIIEWIIDQFEERRLRDFEQCSAVTNAPFQVHVVNALDQQEVARVFQAIVCGLNEPQDDATDVR